MCCKGSCVVNWCRKGLPNCVQGLAAAMPTCLRNLSLSGYASGPPLSSSLSSPSPLLLLSRVRLGVSSLSPDPLSYFSVVFSPLLSSSLLLSLKFLPLSPQPILRCLRACVRACVCPCPHFRSRPILPPRQSDRPAHTPSPNLLHKPVTNAARRHEPQQRRRAYRRSNSLQRNGGG